MPRFSNLKTSLMTLAVFGILALAQGTAKADMVGTCDPDAPGQCVATVSITGNVVTISVTNTSPAANGGFITAVAFNLTPGTVVNNFTTTNANFGLFEPGEWSGNVAPNGTRTHVISTSGEYEGGGSPNAGTGTGATVTFTLTLASLNGNTEASIFNSALIRQRGFEDGGSDKDSLTDVPEPASMLLLGSGLVGVAAGFRRRYSKK